MPAVKRKKRAKPTRPSEPDACTHVARYADGIWLGCGYWIDQWWCPTCKTRFNYDPDKRSAGV